MSGLSEFLLARIAEDEAVARAAAADEGGRWLATGPTSIEASFGELTDTMGAWSGLTEVRRPSITGHITRWDPARVLIECEAKRQIVEDFQILHRDYRETHSPTTEARRFQAAVAMARLTAPYVKHPDYDEDWRP